jgi:hypothetical protein
MLERLCCLIGVVLVFLALLALSPVMFFGLLIITAFKLVMALIS